MADERRDRSFFDPNRETHELLRKILHRLTAQEAVLKEILAALQPKPASRLVLTLGKPTQQ